MYFHYIYIYIYIYIQYISREREREIEKFLYKIFNILQCAAKCYYSACIVHTYFNPLFVYIYSAYSMQIKLKWQITYAPTYIDMRWFIIMLSHIHSDCLPSACHQRLLFHYIDYTVRYADCYVTPDYSSHHPLYWLHTHSSIQSDTLYKPWSSSFGLPSNVLHLSLS